MIETRRYRIDSPIKARQVASQVAALRVDQRHVAEVIIRPERREKTTNQRRLFHAICAEVALELGNTPGEVKMAIKEDFYGVDMIKVGEKVYRSVQSTEEEDGPGYGRLIDFAYIWAAERGVAVPDRRRPA